ncbi:MAG: oligosaccharide flippase family protein, partial [Clostridia bacterium]|nr:oligosaccharide flippase family protein [Clostridia bacterium]
MNVFLRCIAVSFNAYVSAKIGAESLGLFTFVMSVYGFAVTVATSGVNLAAMKLTAERLAPLLRDGGAPSQYRRTMRGVVLACVGYSLAFSTLSGVALYFGSGFVGKHLLGDSRTVLSLKVLAFSLPPIAVTAALSGYFTGVRKVYKNAYSSLLEQAMKIVLTSGALALSIPTLTERVEYSCLAVVGGAAVAEAFSLVVNA